MDIIKDRKYYKIEGMLLVLNKVWWKIPKQWAEYMLAEASDLSSITGGYFMFDYNKEKVIFKKRDDPQI